MFPTDSPQPSRRASYRTTLLLLPKRRTEGFTGHISTLGGRGSDVIEVGFPSVRTHTMTFLKDMLSDVKKFK